MVFAIKLDSQDAFLQFSKMGTINSFSANKCFVGAELTYKKLCEYDSGENIYSTN